MHSWRNSRSFCQRTAERWGDSTRFGNPNLHLEKDMLVVILQWRVALCLNSFKVIFLTFFSHLGIPRFSHSKFFWKFLGHWVGGNKNWKKDFCNPPLPTAWLVKNRRHKMNVLRIMMTKIKLAFFGSRFISCQIRTDTSLGCFCRST